MRKGATEAEARLWAILRDRRLAGYRFRRQHPAAGFILDFACTKYLIAIEADGSQHADNVADMHRSILLEKQGWRILRFWNNDIRNNAESVMEAIRAALTERETLTRSRAMPAPTLSRSAGEG